MKIEVFETREEWLEFRKSYFTSSQIHRLLPNGKRPITEQEKKDLKTKAKTIEDVNLLSEGALTYIYEVIAQTETTEQQIEFYSRSMQRGNEAEPMAALAIADKFGIDVMHEDFMYTSANGIVFIHDDVQGSTPDILMPDEIVQIKCPDSDTHLKYMMIDSEKDFMDLHYDYYVQIQHELFMSRKSVAYFASFDDRFKKKEWHLKLIEINPNKELIDFTQKKIQLAKKEQERILNKLNQL